MSQSTTTMRGFVGSSPEQIISRETKDLIGAKFRMAVSDSYRNKQGEWVDKDAQWFTVKCWGRLGMNVFHSIKKGDPVIVTGRVGMEEWSDAESGANKSGMFVVASAVGLDLNHCMSFKVQSFDKQENAALGIEHDPGMENLQSGQYEVAEGEEILAGEAPF